MSKQIFQKFDVEFRKKVFVPTPEGDDEAVNKAYADSLVLELDDKAEIDGSNTTGGTWRIERLTNNEVGTYINYDGFTNTFGMVFGFLTVIRQMNFNLKLLT